MDYKELKASELRRAEAAVEALNTSKDPYVVYKTSRPITDLKHMLNTSVELYGDNVAFRQRFEKDKPFREITYREALDTVNGLGTALIAHGLNRKRGELLSVGYQLSGCGMRNGDRGAS